MVHTRNNSRGNNVATAAFTTPPQTRRRRLQQTPGSAASVASIASDSSRSTTASARSRNPLPNHLLKQLCEDIEAYGGIQPHIGKTKSIYNLLNHLVEQDPVALSLYKDCRDPIRRKIQQKVYRWQEYYKAGTYEEKVLKVFNVTPARERDIILQVTTTNPPVTPSSGIPEDLLDHDVPSIVTFNNIEEVVEEAKEEVEEEEVDDINMANITVTNIEPILHLKHPWKNPNDILVLTGERSKKNKEEVCTRVDIYIDVPDVRDYQSGSYSLEYLGDGEKLCWEKPVLPMYKRKKADTIKNTEGNDHEEKIYEQHKVVCASLRQNPTWNQQKIVFRLPDGIRVSNETYNEDENGKKFAGKLRVCGVKSKDKSGVAIEQKFFYVKYSMVVKGTTEAIDSIKKNKEEEELSALLQGSLTVESDDED
jgi:hypothetical protein